MDLLTGMNNAVACIEENLEGNDICRKAARAACCSEYHFSRMFSAIAGVTLSEYIRRRRLTLAAFELQRSDTRILDIALKYGYDSADAFARAFYKLHGINPSEARGAGTQLKAYPKLSFHITITGADEMEYRLEDIDFEVRIVGKSNLVSTRQALEQVPALWQEAAQNGLLEQLVAMAWEHPKCRMEGLLGVCGKEASIKDDTFDYFTATRYDGEVPEGMNELILPPHLWAVFPDTVQAWGRIYTDWLPSSGYMLADLPCIECYYAPDSGRRDELWVPVVKGKE
ncbi:AraC family transcriptional regulator [Acetanaerobacterium elongatum]|uniref:Transcriptional regulator, AraC family n=1 Tax=Acetanaerobacterium elongatum TaxID=258515 RepID=A0A1H0GLQ6_9FIRM|nr:helix-turn-helix domain-containing protein [Acetanaerobacterium elongatum]SDO07611.1 transcriptional regulator, AraC family [Acetanaerobacterium elongatum]